MLTWPIPLKYPESKPSTPLTPLKSPESMSKYPEAIAEVHLDMGNIAAESVVYLAWTRGT